MFESLSRFYYNKGLQQADGDDISAALKSLAKAVGYNSNNIEAWNLAGLCFYRLGKYKMAEYCWRQSLSKSGEDNMAGAFLEDLESTLEETGRYFSEVANLCRERKYKKAADILAEEICSRFDLSVDLLNLLGVLRLLEGKISRAEKCWQTVLSIDKANRDAQLYLKNIEGLLSYKLLKLWEKLVLQKLPCSTRQKE